MVDYFFHHSMSDLRCFNYELMGQKSSVLKKLFSKKNIFPWLYIRHDQSVF
jgi:hypothetical protein